MILRFLSIALLCAVTAACNQAPTGYQSSSSGRGGYSEQKVSDNLYLVSGNGNAYTDKQRLQKIILLRAAHLTRDNGHSHFEVVLGTGVFAGSKEEILSPLLAYRGGGGGGGFYYRAPVMVTTHRSYSYPVYVGGGYGGYGAGPMFQTGSLLIRMTDSKGATKDLQAFSAQKVIAKLEPQLTAPVAEAK